MLSIFSIHNQLREKVLSCCPDVANAPQAIKDIYASAVDFFGEEQVDLQRMENPTMWNHVLGSSGVSHLLRLFGIPEGLFPYTSSDFHSVLQEEDKFARFLSLITAERLQNGTFPVYCIMVHFHDITVANENDDSTQIEDIYSSTCISYRGYHSLFNFWFRSTVSRLHYRSAYRHSHLPRGRDPEWNRPCLGRGPITMTMNTLQSTSDVNFWNLFWLELDKCIRVESLEGGPYTYIRDILDRGRVRNDFDCFRYTNPYRFDSSTCSNMFDEIALRVLKSAQLQYAFRSNNICIVTPFEDFTVEVSNCALNYLQQLHEQDSEKAEQLTSQLFRNGWMIFGQITTTGHILSYGSESPMTTPPDRPAGFSFKGTPVTFKVVETAENQRTFYHLLSPELAGYLKNKLTILINNIYARKQSTRSSKTRTH